MRRYLKILLVLLFAVGVSPADFSAFRYSGGGC